MASLIPPQISTDNLGPFSGISTLAQLLIDQASKEPDQEAVVHGDARLGYRELLERTQAIAHQLIALGVQPTDKVGILFPNHLEFVACFFAVVGLKAVVVPINPLLKSEEIAHILRDSQSKFLITHVAALPEISTAIQCQSTIQVILVHHPAGQNPEESRFNHQNLGTRKPGDTIECTQETGKQIPGRSETFDLTPVEAKFPDIFDLTPFRRAPGMTSWPVGCSSESDLAVLVYTSGTTGKPKGAMLSHQNLSFVLESCLEALQLGDRERILAVLPLCHIYGLTVVMLGIISRGGTLIIQDKFNAQQALSTIEKEKITFLPAVPTMYQFMLMELENNCYDLSSLRLCLSGGAALPREMLSEIEEKLAVTVIEGYGLSEVSSVATVNRLDRLRKPGSVGSATNGVEIAIIDDRGLHLPSGPEHIGEVAVKGKNVMQGYYRQPEATRSVLQGDWFFTGDLGYKDHDGDIFIVGRAKELIIRGGQNVYPCEVENVILRMKEVREVAVIGVPDRLMGERVKAVVAVRPDSQLSEDEVKSFCARYLADYKVPRLVAFTNELPKNSTGKVLKRLLS